MRKIRKFCPDKKETFMGIIRGPQRYQGDYKSKAKPDLVLGRILDDNPHNCTTLKDINFS